MLIELRDVHYVEADEIIDIQPTEKGGEMLILMASGIEHTIPIPVGRDHADWFKRWANYINAHKAVEPLAHERVESVRPA